MLNHRQQASAVRRLIAACGGLEEASTACGASARPYSVTQLSRCQTPGTGCFLPSDIIACLEDYCGDPIFGQALVDARPSKPLVADLMTEAAESTEAAASFQSKVRRAIADGVITATEQTDLEREAEVMFEQAREARDAVQKLRVAA